MNLEMWHMKFRSLKQKTDTQKCVLGDNTGKGEKKRNIRRQIAYYGSFLNISI
jgi:hypothetical protein